MNKRVKNKIVDVLLKTPAVNMIPLLLKIAIEAPKLWDAIPQKKKRALAEAGVDALTKLLVTYARGRVGF